MRRLITSRSEIVPESAERVQKTWASSGQKKDGHAGEIYHPAGLFLKRGLHFFLFVPFWAEMFKSILLISAQINQIILNNRIN